MMICLVFLPTILGRPFSNSGNVPEEEEELNEKIYIFVGGEALNKGGPLQLNRPMEKKEIKDFVTMEQIWKHIFYNELLTETKTHSVFVIEAPFSSSENKKKCQKFYMINSE